VNHELYLTENEEHEREMAGLDYHRRKVGSGSREKDSSLSIVAMEKEKQACLLHHLGRGKTTTSCGQNGPVAGAGYSSSAPHEQFLRSLFLPPYGARKAITADYAAQKSVKQCPLREAAGRASHKRKQVCLLRSPNA
jgi:hypothetical protein